MTPVCKHPYFRDNFFESQAIWLGSHPEASGHGSSQFLDMVFKSVYCNADFVSPVFMRTQILMQRKRGKLFFSGAVPIGLYVKKDRGYFTSLKKIICAFFLTESTIRFKMGCLGFTQGILLFD